jgi:cation-transporting ATPase 13A3/4/5
LATCHSLKIVDEEIIGDPLDVRMFEFTKWTLDEGRIAGTRAVKSKGVVIEHTALVQTVVRPPGTARFKLEDALKGGSRVGSFASTRTGYMLTDENAARTFLRAGCHSNF